MAMQRKKSKSEKSGTGKQNRDIKAISPEKEKKIAAQVIELAGPLCEAEGIELVHVEYQRESRGRILRLYIDKPGGVTLDDCAFISRQLGDILDVSFEHSLAYNLEVSSPGLERPLGKESDYEKFRGQKASIRTYQPVDGKKKFQGILDGISDGTVLLKVNDKTVFIPFQVINRARLVNSNGENGC
jgi:ribosome maturation factor RimP